MYCVHGFEKHFTRSMCTSVFLQQLSSDLWIAKFPKKNTKQQHCVTLYGIDFKYELIVFDLYCRAFLFILFFHFVLLLDLNATVLVAFYFNYERPHTVHREYFFYAIQSTIAKKSYIITELMRILKSNSCKYKIVLASNILTHYCTLT